MQLAALDWQQFAEGQTALPEELLAQGSLPVTG